MLQETHKIFFISLSPNITQVHLVLVGGYWKINNTEYYCLKLFVTHLYYFQFKMMLSSQNFKTLTGRGIRYFNSA